jgi:superfamily II DNA or RNA helicase
VGLFPVLRDDTCWLLAVALETEDDARAYLAACSSMGVPAVADRGGQVWTFFAEPVAAGLARRLGESLLTRAMRESGRPALDAYDRICPAQGTTPRSGHGCLVALPLPASLVDPATGRPASDPWALLAGQRRMSAAAVRDAVAAAERSGAVLAVRESLTGTDAGEDPWTLPPSGPRAEPPVAGPLPERVTLTLGSLAAVDGAGLPPALTARLGHLAAFANPEFRRREAMRLSVHATPRVIQRAEHSRGRIALPRGLAAEAQALLAAHGIAVDVEDARTAGRPVDVAFRGELTPAQRRAAEAVLAHDDGVLCAPTAFGKTVVAAWVIAARRVSTLVIVHRQVLLDQWRAQLAAFLGLPPRAIGQLGAGHRHRLGEVDIALFQSLHPADLAGYGLVIVDECHHVPAASFEAVMRAISARYILGLTATPVRRDGLHPLIVMRCGPIRFESDLRGAPRPFAQVVVPRRTVFRLPGEPAGIQEVYAALAADAGRNAAIVADAADLVAEGRTPLLVTERTDHVATLADAVRERLPEADVVVLHGGLGARARQAAVETLAAGSPCVVVATGRYVGEGFDAGRPDTLLLAMPVSWWGTVAQYAGRVSRPHAGKREVRIYDYADLEVPLLAGMYRRRLRAYRALGYVVRPAP